MNIRKMLYIPNPPKYHIDDDYIIWNSQRYDYELMDSEFFEEIEGDCRNCCFDTYRNSKGFHTCPAKDSNFDWSCSRFIPDFQIFLKKSET